MRITSLSFLVILFLSCGTPDADPITCNYSSSSAVGQVTNRPWIFREGLAVPRANTDGFEVRLYEENEIEFIDICDTDLALLVGIEIKFFIGNEAAEIPIGGSHLLFVEDKSFGISSTHTGGGCVKVDAITDSTISGRITFDSDGDKVNGTWSATRCD